MALEKFTRSGEYGQIELNQVAFRRDGRIEAQCKLDATDFADTVAENGMILAIDQVNRTVKFPTGSDDLYALNYSAEHMYDERKNGLKDFYLGKEDFLPRLGYLAVGDKFTTNTIVYDDAVTSLSTVSDIKAAVTTGLYAKPCTTSGGEGYWELTTSKAVTGPVVKAVKYTIMPDGQDGIKFQVVVA